MKSMIKITAVAAAFALSACGGADDRAAENVEEAAEIEAENLDAMADNATTEAAEDALENRADAVEEAGEQKAEQIDDADAGAAVESNVSGM